MDNGTEPSHSSPESSGPSLQPRQAAPGPARNRPCDVCRKRKLKCVKEAGEQCCVLCKFHNRDCTFMDEPQKRKRARLERPSDQTEQAPQPAPAGHAVPQPPSGPSLLNQTLGLHRTMHSRYVGSSSIHDGLLVGLDDAGPSREHVHASPSCRRVEPSTMFLSRLDDQTPLYSGDLEELESIETIVRPHGPALVELYFRIVHPSYPILHKGVFLEKYARSYKEFSPPLLAAVYLLAMDWWEYDKELSPQKMPDGERLFRTATKAMASVIHRPKLSTVQASLLLLQRSGGDSWVLTSQLVGLAEELGLHISCMSWSVPEWEKGLRRRLSWAVFMQDKWGALIHGRPSHIKSNSWDLRPLNLGDFPESAADEDSKEGSTEVDKGRHLFIHLARLTVLMANALESLYGSNTQMHTLSPTRDVRQVLEIVKPIAIDLKDWVKDMPFGLAMTDLRSRKLCSNGYLHLSYFATEIMMHRQIVRALFSKPCPEMERLCREAASTRLDRAMDFVESLRPEHLEGFWWFASAKCLALIGVYGALLWATSTSEEEAVLYRQKLDDFRWSLKVRAKSSRFVSNATRELDEALMDLEMVQPWMAVPVPSNRRSTEITEVANQATRPDSPIWQDVHNDADTSGNGIADIYTRAYITDPQLKFMLEHGARLSGWGDGPFGFNYGQQ